ncbi:rhodanese-like domain-containing protein [Tenacibaculum sp. UWU-22]|uniref:rhodanese-like domain-containing protein n=1 Tax=Tenacibaculum sp. UWU-22 TaxID=3234187 RepID=UPI0034DB13EC
MKNIVISLFTAIMLTACNQAQEVKSISTSELKTLLTKQSIQLLDVRTPEEYNRGHIENAKQIDFYSPNFLTDAIKNIDKSKPVYIYCHSGGRSLKASEMLSKKGFKTVNVEGGFSAWKNTIQNNNSKDTVH